MRIGLVSDVHGNDRALLAVLTATPHVDQWVSAGDVVGYGARPRECLDLLDAVGAMTVAGNHELMVLGLLGTERCTPLAAASVAWTRQQLDEDALRRLAALPRQLRLPGMTVAHGSLDDPQEYVRSGERADELVTEAGQGCLVLGHTHEPWLRWRGHDVLRQGIGHTATDGRRLLVNPGSVGQSRMVSPEARFAVVDLDGGRVELRAVPYDWTAARRDLARAGLPRDSYHCRPRRGRAAARRALRWSGGRASRASRA